MVERGISTVLGYVLVVGILTLLLTGMLGGFAGLVSEQQTDASRSSLTIVAHDAAGSIEIADRLATREDETNELVVRSDLPDRVGEHPYELELVVLDQDTNQYQLETRIGTDHRVVVTFRTNTPIDPSSIRTYDGGPIRISLEDGTLVIDRV